MVGLVGFVSCGGTPAPTPAVQADGPEVLGRCDLEVSSAKPVEFRTLYADLHINFGDLDYGYTQTIGSDTAFAEFQAHMLLSLAPVDFVNESVVAIWQVAEDCNFDMTGHDVTDVGSSYLVSAEFEDESTGCLEPCLAPGGGLVIVAVPRDKGAEVCRKTWDLCSD
jgi:hypothetical protein